MKLVIVESPAKTRALAGYLGPGYRVMASFGHVRDLPQDAFGVVFAQGRVEPSYVVLPRAAEVIARLTEAARDVEAIYLATDPDREGEAIAWHLAQTITSRTCLRARFHAITADAVLRAIAEARPIDHSLVDAQQARRILDRVVGFAVSPTCARGSGHREARSAGRVQSVALRLVVERERQIGAFTPQMFHIPVAHLRRPGTKAVFRAELVSWKGEPLGHRLTDPDLAARTAAWCLRQTFTVLRRDDREVSVPSPAPFVTATLQQAASVQLKLSPDTTMALAQALYEAGLITYMRTDSPHLSAEAVAMARSEIGRAFPGEYLPATPPVHEAPGAHAQEAHEAIRPTDLGTDPAQISDPGRRDLYQCIRDRFLASQMADGRDRQGLIEVAVAPGSFIHPGRGPLAMGVFRASGVTVVFDGWRRLIGSAAEETIAIGEASVGRRPLDPTTTTADEGAPPGTAAPSGGSRIIRLPAVAVGDVLEATEVNVRSATTKPPPRYTEAGLIKVLERRGIGRPSTYAAILATILDRAYVRLVKRMLHATDLGMALTDFLIRAYSGNFIEPDFTNQVEADLDRIARGDIPWEPFVTAASQIVVGLARSAGLPYDPLGGDPPPWSRPGGSGDGHRPGQGGPTRPRQPRPRDGVPRGRAPRRPRP